MDSNLEKIAQKAKDKFEETPMEDMNGDILPEEEPLTEYEEEMSEEEIEESEPFDDDDEPVIGIGSEVKKMSDTMHRQDKEKQLNHEPEFTDDDLFDAPLEDSDQDAGDDVGITIDVIVGMLEDLPENIRGGVAKELMDEIKEYKKDLIVSQGFSIAEADTAGKNYLTKRIKEKTSEIKKEAGGDAVIIELRKGEEGKLELPDEAKDKVVKSKVIQLKMVEDAELANIPIEKIPSRQKLKLINSLDSFLSQYSVPLPLLHDYVQFKGSQIIQLIQAVQYEDATPAEIIQKKASLIYSQLTSGAVVRKFDDDGKTIMSFSDFTKKFYFHDMDLALYAILVASSMEEIDSRFTCAACDQIFETRYSIKNLLNLDHLSDEFKEIFDEILSHKDDPEFLSEMDKNAVMAWRAESPLTKNIYDLQYPTIAEAITVQKHIDPEDQVSVYLGSMLMFIKKVYIFNRESGKYAPLDINEDLKEIFEVMSRVPQEELDVLLRFLSPKIYTPRFILNSQCDHCGYRMENRLLVEDMVFLKARDMQMEIR